MKRLVYNRLGLLCCIPIFCLLWNCKSSDVTKDENYISDINTLEQLMQTEDYYVEIEIAYPFATAATQQVVNSILLNRTGNSANRVDVRGDGHFIEIKADSVEGDLSFFGERRSGGGHYGSTNGGILFKGVPRNYEKAINKQKKNLEIKFNISGEQNENYDVSLKIFPNKKADVNISSSYRTFMRYEGTLKPKTESL